MQIRTLVQGMIGTNCYIVKDDEGRGYVIDPAFDADEIKDALAQMEIAEPIVLITHGHFDHVSALADLGMGRVYAHALEIPALKQPGRAMQGFAQKPYLGDVQPLKEGESIGCFTALETPGHRPGSLCFYNGEEGVLFAGDTLFQRGYGRTDLEGGSQGDLVKSLQRLFLLSGETKVYPGHGPSTAIGLEKGLYL